jgi:hypothetical protein
MAKRTLHRVSPTAMARPCVQTKCLSVVSPPHRCLPSKASSPKMTGTARREGSHRWQPPADSGWLGPWQRALDRSVRHGDLSGRTGLEQTFSHHERVTQSGLPRFDTKLVFCASAVHLQSLCALSAAGLSPCPCRCSSRLQLSYSYPQVETVHPQICMSDMTMQRQSEGFSEFTMVAYHLNFLGRPNEIANPGFVHAKRATNNVGNYPRQVPRLKIAVLHVDSVVTVALGTRPRSLCPWLAQENFIGTHLLSTPPTRLPWVRSRVAGWVSVLICRGAQDALKDATPDEFRSNFALVAGDAMHSSSKKRRRHSAREIGFESSRLSDGLTGVSSLA